MRQSRLHHRLLAGVLIILSLISKAIATTAEEASTLFQNQDWTAAAVAYNALLETDSENGQYWFRLGQIRYQQQDHSAAIDALTRATQLTHASVPPAFAWLFLARSQAAAGETAAAIASLAEIEATGARPYLAISNMAEFSDLAENNEFQAVLETLKPCNTPEYRAFDFWLGEWEVTMPTRPGWSATNTITLGNNGCSIHEHYVAQGGFTGSSINFYNAQAGQWHQTWIDNQGNSLSLNGGYSDGHMRMGDASSRITWTLLDDGRVRQLWESTADEGKTWTVAFDGYYKRKQ